VVAIRSPSDLLDKARRRYHSAVVKNLCSKLMGLALALCLWLVSSSAFADATQSATLEAATDLCQLHAVSYLAPESTTSQSARVTTTTERSRFSLGADLSELIAAQCDTRAASSIAKPQLTTRSDDSLDQDTSNLPAVDETPASVSSPDSTENVIVAGTAAIAKAHWERLAAAVKTEARGPSAANRLLRRPPR
jgi:hypothetical protein